jgi:hypothetical protein
MKLCLAAAAATLMAVSVPAATAATMTPVPAKKCYRDEESVNLEGTGFSPNANVTIEKDGVPFPHKPVTSPTGEFLAQLTFAQSSGQSRRTYTATDTVDPGLEATTRLTVTALTVRIEPQTGEPGKVLRIGARGFTDGKTLYAHIVRRGKRPRNVRIGRLKGPCAKLVARKRLFRANAPLGSYTVQFDAHRRYRRGTEVKYPFSVDVSGGPRAAASAWRPGG